MLRFAGQLRRLRVDYYEYVTMKVVVLLTSGKDNHDPTGVLLASDLCVYISLLTGQVVQHLEKNLFLAQQALLVPHDMMAGWRVLTVQHSAWTNVI